MKKIIKRLKSKTYWTAIGIAVMGALQTAKPEDFGIPPDKVGFALIGIAVAVAVLRELTTKPVTSK